MKTFFLAAFTLSFTALLGQQGPPTAEQIRKSISGEIQSFKISPDAIYKIENKSINTGTDSVKIRIYYPDNQKNHQIIFNIHGGALVACDLDTHDNISRVLSNKTQSVVVAIDYRKPPEFPYPASIYDCEQILSWIQKNAASINGNSANIILLGDSGGGLLITSLAAKLRNQLAVKAICLINPATDLSSVKNGFYALVTNWYLNGKNANDSLISPILAKDVHYYPKTLIITCEKDELKPHGVALYDKLSKSGREVELFEIPAEDHLGTYWPANHPIAKKAVDKTIQFIQSLKTNH